MNKIKSVSDGAVGKKANKSLCLKLFAIHMLLCTSPLLPEAQVLFPAPGHAQPLWKLWSLPEKTSLEIVSSPAVGIWVPGMVQISKQTLEPSPIWWLECFQLVPLMFAVSAGSKQTNRFPPAARNEHGQNKAPKCDPILIEVDGKTPTEFSTVGSAPDWGCYWKGSWTRWVSRNLWNESWKPLDVFLSLLWAWAHPAAESEEEIQHGHMPGNWRKSSSPASSAGNWQGVKCARGYLTTLCFCAFLHKGV